MNVIPRFICMASSLSLAMWIYAINNEISLPAGLLTPFFSVDAENPELWKVGWQLVSYLIYFLLLLGIAYWTTTFFKHVRYDTEVGPNEITGICGAGEDMTFTYFGLFFYALSVKGLITFFLTFILLCCGLYCTARYVFNPLYLFLGYKFYKVKTGDTSGYKTITVLSKNTYQFNDTVSFGKLIPITPFTFVELEEKNNT